MTIDFGVAKAVDAQSYGEPGQRTFRLRLVGAKSESASLWLEKEHLGALSMAFKQVLAQLGYGGGPQEAALDEFPEAPEHDFLVGAIGIGFDPSNQTVVLQFGEAGKQEEVALSAQLSLDHCAALVGRLDQIIVAGRPLCPLCGQPVELSGHVCIRSNGHSRQPIPESGGDEGRSA